MYLKTVIYVLILYYAFILFHEHIWINIWNVFFIFLLRFDAVTISRRGDVTAQWRHDVI